MISAQNNPVLGIRFVLMAMVFFAAQDAISTYLAARYPVPFFVMIRYWFFAAFVIAMSAGQPGGVQAAAHTRLPVIQVLRGLLLAGQILVIVTSFKLIGLAPTHALFSLHPLLATLLAIPLLGEKVGWRRFAAIGFGFIGVLIVLRPGAEVFQIEALVAVLAAVMLALYSVLTRLANAADGHAKASFFYTGIAGAILLTLIGVSQWAPMTWSDASWLGVLSVCGMCGHYCLIRALDATEAVRIQPFVYLQMVFGIFLGWLIFGESLDFWMVIGVSVIVGAGLYAIWREWRLTLQSQSGRAA